MRFSTTFSRWIGAGGTALGSDTVPNGSAGTAGTAPHGQDNLLVARFTNQDGAPAKRVAVAYNYVGVGVTVALPATLYLWDGTTERWYTASTSTLTDGTITYFDAVSIVDSPILQTSLGTPTAGSLEAILIVTDPGTAPTGQHVFSMSADLAAGVGTGGADVSTIVAGTGILVAEAPADTWTVSADFGTGAGKVLQALKASVESVLGLVGGTTSFMRVSALGVLTAGTIASADLPAFGGDVSGVIGSLTVAKINGSTVPAGGALTTGNTLGVTGAGALGYSALNLAGGANYVTGVLPTANQAAQALGGDATGTTAAVAVVSLTGTAGVVTGPTTAISIGTTPATTGALRLDNAAFVRARTQDTLSTFNLIGSTSANKVQVGGTLNSGVTILVPTASVFNAQVNSVDCFTVGATYATIGAVASAAAAGSLRGPQAGSYTGRNNAGTFDINIASWSASDVLTFGGTVNSSIIIGTATSGTIALQVNAAPVATFGASYVAIGTVASAGSIGALRVAGNGTDILVSKTSGGTDLPIIITDTSNNIKIGISVAGANTHNTMQIYSGSSTSGFFFYPGTTSSSLAWQLASIASGLQAGSTVVTPTISQALRISDSACQNFTVRAQGAFSTGGALANINGGAFIVQGGTISTSTAGGLRKGVRLEYTSANETMVEATEVFASQRILSLCRGAVLTTTQCPTGTQDLVVYLGNAAGVPNASPVSGCYVYANTRPYGYSTGTVGQHQALMPTYATKVWPSDANYTAAVAEYTAWNIVLTGGSLGAQRNFVVPLAAGYRWTVFNNTSGGQAIQVIAASGTGIVIATGKTATVYCDGTNILRETADV